MPIQVTAIRQEGGRTHAHITQLRGRDGAGVTHTYTRAGLVNLLESGRDSAFVADAIGRVSVGVVKPSTGSKYVQTHRDGRWTDNLLALPRF